MAAELLNQEERKMDFTFYMPARVISGPGAVLENGGQIKKLGDRALLVTGAHSAQESGVLQDYEKVLKEQGISYEIFDQISANPLYTACRDAARQAIGMGADMIIGLGGGSPLDAAKAVAAIAANPDITPDELLQKSWKKKPLPVVVTGTTSGTGSEVSSTSVLTWEDGRKRAISHPDLYASLVLADPRYTFTMSWKVTVSTALDALSHAVEGFLSPRCTQIPQWCAQQAIPMIWKGLKELSRSKTVPQDLRDPLFYGSLWAGMVLNGVGTAFPHPFGYILTEDYSIPHGRACAAFLPALLERAGEYAPERVEELEQLLGCSQEEAVPLLHQLSDTHHIRMTQEKIEGYARRWENLHNFDNVPGGYSVQQGKQLFSRMFDIKV